MKVMIEGLHLLDDDMPPTLPLRYVRMENGFEVQLGFLPIAFIQEDTVKSEYSIQTMPTSPQFSGTFPSLHVAVCVCENLIRTGGTGEWLSWPLLVKDPQRQTVHVHMEDRGR